MFVRQFRNSLDNKYRLTVPARYREFLTAGAYVTRGFDGNLAVYPLAKFEEIAQKVNSTSVTDDNARLLKRLIFASADKVDMDGAGRILLADFLREAAGIQGDVILAGVGDHFEIWAAERWAEQDALLSDDAENARRFAELKI
jgi:MraZ protein